jgi:5-(carboxyamino)imidazole ribonucleotide mutase
MADVLILLGSKSDIEVAKRATTTLDRLSVTWKMAVASAHRTPDRVRTLVEGSDAKVMIAIAGLSAALPGVVAAHTTRPVIGVPVSGPVNMDAILSIVQMPPGIPVAAVGLDRGDNAAILSAQIMALSDPALAKRLKEHRAEMAAKVEKDSLEVQ